MNKDIIYILNYGWENRNYGAILTAYALQQVLTDYFNKESYIVNNSEDIHNKITQKLDFSKKFKEKYMKFTPHITSWEDYKKLNENSNTFIVGSDQVFRPKIKMEEGFEAYFLDFVDIKAKKIAFSASFGVSKELYEKENSPQVINKIKKLLNLFDYLSVRETSGVQIAEELFNVKTEWIIDPVFMIDKSHYENLAKNSDKDFKNKIVSYVINDNQNFKIAKKYLSKKYNKPIVDLFNSNSEVETWLNAIKTCDLFLTDSFHGFCFSIIFNKPAIVIVNSAVGDARYDSIVDLLNLKKNYIFSPLEILKKDCLFIYNYEEVNQCIDIQRQKGINFLQKALEGSTNPNENRYKLRIEYLENKISELSQKQLFMHRIKKILHKQWVIFFHTALPAFLKNIIRRFK